VCLKRDTIFSSMSAFTKAPLAKQQKKDIVSDKPRYCGIHFTYFSSQSGSIAGDDSWQSTGLCSFCLWRCQCRLLCPRRLDRLEMQDHESCIECDSQHLELN
jgi:hypothetical protein